MFGLFQQRIRVECGDGPAVFVHKNVNNAIPLFLNEKSRKFKFGLGLSGQAKGNLGAEQADAVHSVLMKLNDANSVLMADYRMAYEVYAADPCRKSDYLERATDEIRARKDRLSELELKLRALIDLAKLGAGAQNQVNEKVVELLSLMEVESNAEAAAKEIANMHEIATDLTEPGES